MIQFALMAALVLGQVTTASADETRTPSEAIHLMSQQIEPVVLMNGCKLVRTLEPRGELTFKIRQHGGVISTVVRPIYSDLCTHPTQQFVSRIFVHLASSPHTPIIGFTGSNEDQKELSFPVFSSFVLRPLN